MYETKAQWSGGASGAVSPRPRGMRIVRLWFFFNFYWFFSYYRLCGQCQRHDEQR